MTTTAAPLPTVQPGSFLTLHYRLAGPAGDVINTFNDKPATLSLGTGELSPAMEQRLLGLAEGTRTSFELAAGEAFGERNADMQQWVARKLLNELGDPDEKYNVGDVVEVTLDLDVRDQMAYVLVEDPLPAGFEGVLERVNPIVYGDYFFPYFWREWGYNRKDVRDDKVVRTYDVVAEAYADQLGALGALVGELQRGELAGHGHRHPDPLRPETAHQRGQLLGGALDALVGPIGQPEGSIRSQVQLRRPRMRDRRAQYGGLARRHRELSSTPLRLASSMLARCCG